MDRVLLGVVGLAFCVEGIYAIRTARAEFRFSMWYGFEATRREQPLRFWIYCVLNFTLGGWMLAVSVFSESERPSTLDLVRVDGPEVFILRKNERLPRLVPPEKFARGFDLEDYRNQYCYVASVRVGSELQRPTLLFEKCR